MKKMFADFEMAMDPSRNHRLYRLSVAKLESPIIPFMPLLMKGTTLPSKWLLKVLLVGGSVFVMWDDMLKGINSGKEK